MCTRHKSLNYSSKAHHFGDISLPCSWRSWVYVKHFSSRHAVEIAVNGLAFVQNVGGNIPAYIKAQFLHTLVVESVFLNFISQFLPLYFIGFSQPTLMSLCTAGASVCLNFFLPSNHSSGCKKWTNIEPLAIYRVPWMPLPLAARSLFGLQEVNLHRNSGLKAKGVRDQSFLICHALQC